MAVWSMMLALFFNPLGFDIVQFWLIQATGSLWAANLSLYAIAAFFFGLSILLRFLYKRDTKTDVIH